ncbi:MAG: hypothetical protein HYZ37_12365 [Candidatus Solibacter usitatus]|nr:hypothetical protein [Candidatus Solibacter usitatus]
MVFIATQNMASPDRLLEAPSAAAGRTFFAIGQYTSRAVLRYQVSELNKYFFQVFGLAQIIVVLLVGITYLFSTRGSKPVLAVSCLLLGLVLFEQFFLIPEINTLSQVLDFKKDSAQAAAENERFSRFRTFYGVTEFAKAMLMLTLAAKVLIRREIRKPVRMAALGEDEGDEALLKKQVLPDPNPKRRRRRSSSSQKT